MRYPLGVFALISAYSRWALAFSQDVRVKLARRGDTNCEIDVMGHFRTFVASQGASNRLEFCQRLGERAHPLAKELGERAELAVLQCPDRNWMP